MITLKSLSFKSGSRREEEGLEFRTGWEGRFTPAGPIKSYIEVALARPAGVNDAS
jgi:hypothetical protein